MSINSKENQAAGPKSSGNRVDSIFNLTSRFTPTGDQPEAINQLSEGIERGDAAQVLLGVTGSGKTFTMANVIARCNRPTLILSHNKTLAAQLYEEMRGFFPDNAVEYYVSYYDYYQPEAYIPRSDTYIEKDLAINENIDRLRLSAVSSLLSGRRDVIVVASVSCIYGMGGPAAMKGSVINLSRGMLVERNALLRRLVDALYTRNDIALERGTFRVKGDTIDIAMAYSERILRVTLWDDEIDSIEELDGETMQRVASFSEYTVYPANIFVTSKEQADRAIRMIQDDLTERIAYYENMGDTLRAQRIKERVEYDMEMIKELGHCSGIENYSRYFDGRQPGERPYCLFDFFPEDVIVFIDESHASIPQLHAMSGNDRSRKENLVEYGFRLPAAFDNRPLRFDEFESLVHQVIYVSATPAEYELQRAEGVVVEQIIRPTGLLDPPIEVRPTHNQIDNLMEEIVSRQERDERTLVITLTKRMAEEMTTYLLSHDIPTAYIHSDVDTLDRIKIITDLRAGEYDVLVGVNLLREGLDIPEVSLVAILDADKEGFLRNARGMTQMAGRAARNVNGLVIMYADRVTQSMQVTIEETSRRRTKQIAYNMAHGITPEQIRKEITGGRLADMRRQSFDAVKLTAPTSLSGSTQERKQPKAVPYIEPDERRYLFPESEPAMAADPIMRSMSPDEIRRTIGRTRELMREAATRLDFIQAAQYRDEMLRLESMLPPEE
ncbi:MAG: excinuclease ABC subunit UvrB [Prevotella sp.]|nr:excinuclease ABC subunit UvrB [Prevotella sp.]